MGVNRGFCSSVFWQVALLYYCQGLKDLRRLSQTCPVSSGTHIPAQEPRFISGPGIWFLPEHCQTNSCLQPCLPPYLWMDLRPMLQRRHLAKVFGDGIKGGSSLDLSPGCA